MAQRNRSVSLKAGKSKAALTITQPNAAGIDVGSAFHFVAVPPDRDDEPVREFPSFTVDLNALADWLFACGGDTVAMESTGVYWIPLFELLESPGANCKMLNKIGVILAASVFLLSGERAKAQDENIGQVQQPLVRGQLVNLNDQEAFGLLTLTNPSGTCSASMLNRYLRIIAGLILVALTGFGLIGAWGYLGVILIATGMIAICPLYTLLGVRSTSR